MLVVLLGILIILLIIDFLLAQRGGAAFHCLAFDYSFSDWSGFSDIKHVPWKDTFNVSDAVLLFEWFQASIDVVFFHWKYQVKPHSARCFLFLLSSAAAVIACRTCKTTPLKSVFSGQIFIELSLMVTLIEILELAGFGYMTTFTI